MCNLFVVSNKVVNTITDHFYYEIKIWDKHNIVEFIVNSTPTSNFGVLKVCIDSIDENVIDLIENIKENKRDIYINDIYYKWTDIKHLFEKNVINNIGISTDPD